MKKLRIHCFQHVPFEGLGSIEEWIIANDHSLDYTRFFENSKLPEITDLDWLIIMGGPMSVNDETKFPWLIKEKEFIRKAIKSGVKVLGICLGSQLVANALGAKVLRNKHNEVGWFDIDLTTAGQKVELFHGMPEKMRVFHWHGDKFDIPEKAVHLASSAGCRNQAFLLKKSVLALQFHLELTPELLKAMVDNGSSDLVKSEFVQTEHEILINQHLIKTNREILFRILSAFAGISKPH